MYTNENRGSYMTNNFDSGSWDYHLGAYDGRGTPPTVSQNLWQQVAAGQNWSSIYRCPSDQIPVNNTTLFYRRSYAINQFEDGNVGAPGFVGFDGTIPSQQTSRLHARKVSQVGQSSTAIVLMDRHRDSNRINSPEIVGVVRMWFVTPLNPAVRDSDREWFPHSPGKMNCLYADGHVQMVDRTEACGQGGTVLLPGNATNTQFDAAKR